MDYQLSKEETAKIQEGIREKFSEVAVSPEGLFNYPTGRNALKKLKYQEKPDRKSPR